MIKKLAEQKNKRFHINYKNYYVTLFSTIIENLDKKHCKTILNTTL